jgi:type II secretory ATPase GspE/PulE/Tfp pilus assembly ATPase PilB-like protein
VAQRLVRTHLPKCKEEYQPTEEEELMELNLRPEDVRAGVLPRRGCDNCNARATAGAWPSSRS